MAESRRITKPDREKANTLLSELWEMALNNEQIVVPEPIRSLVNAEEVGMRFCLPTQLLGKLADNSLDALVLQTRAGPPGNWNARTFSSRVIVPWNRANQRVLGNSGDPYVSNPLRRPRLDFQPEQLDDPEQWELVCDVLRDVESKSDEGHTREVLLKTLAAIRDRLREFSFNYALPDRISIQQAEGLARDFLSEKSGGDRGLAVAAALFETIRAIFGIYKEIRRGVINAADTAMEAVGDLDCIDQYGKIILAVEVKERRIGDDDLHITIAKAREAAVRELLFCTDGIMSTQLEEVEATIKHSWTLGMSIYQVNVHDLIHALLPTTGERGVKLFVGNVGEQLDSFNTQPKHRKAWKTLLDAL